MIKRHNLKMRSILAGALSAVMVLTSCPTTALATDELLLDEPIATEQSVPAQDTALDSAMSDLEVADDSILDADQDTAVLTEETESEAAADNGAALIEDADTASDAALQDGIEADAATEPDAVPVEEAADTVDEAEPVSEEESVEEVVPDEEITEASAEEAVEEEVLSAAAEDETLVEETGLSAAAAVEEEVVVAGKRNFFYTNFKAELTDATINVAVSNLFVGRGATMKAQYVSVDEFLEKIEEQNYGKVVSGTKAIQLTFLDASGNEITPIGLSISIKAKNMDAESYALYRANEYTVRKVGTSAEPAFDFYTSFAETYILAGLKKDDALRTEGKRANGKTTFALAEGDTNINVTAPNGAFYGSISMEAKMVSEDVVREDVEKVLGKDTTAAEITAYDISFHAGSKEDVEPNKEVTVTINMPINAESTYRVIHIPDEGEGEPTEVKNVTLTANGVTFNAKDFSVYAVVEGGQVTPEARATVNFYGTDLSKPVATVYVKNSDVLLGDGVRETNKSYIEDIVYDPGVGGVLPSGQLFKGWSIDTDDSNTDGPNYTTETEPMDIAQIRSYLAGLSDIKEGDVINIYAMIFETITVTYIGEKNVSLGTDTLIRKAGGDPVEYTVNMAYTPGATQNFEGWNVGDGASKIIEAKYNGENVDPPYLNTTKLKLNGSIKLSVFAPEGFWLVFDENGKGATYNAPRFIKSTETPYDYKNELLPMVRNGYSFVGWYYGKPSEVGGEPTGDEFDFNKKLEESTTIYAKWEVNTNANYTVVVWKQNVDGSDYDYEEAITLEGPSNSAINTIVQNGATVTDVNDSYKNYKINGVEKAYTGFHADRFDTGKTISPDGNTVVNVYYNRNMVELRFFSFNATNGYTYYNGSNLPWCYGRFNNSGYPSNNGQSYVKLYLLTNGYYGYRTDGTYSNYYDDYKYVENGEYLVTYYGNKYTRNGSWNQIQNLTMRGLYGSTLSDNNETWPTSYNWWSDHYDGGVVGGTRTTFLDAFLPTSTESIVNFYGEEPEGSFTIYFYKQNADLNGYSVANTVKVTGGTFLLSDKYTGFKCAEWSDNGNNWYTVGSLDERDGNYYYDADVDQDGHQDITYNSDLHIRFNRLSYKIKYSDGAYFDGNNNAVEEDKISAGFGESELITYGADISEYGDKDSKHYNKPTREGYVFEGWYADETCQIPYNFNKMPLNGVQVYAKWRKIQFRVFLHPNVPETDSSLNWGTNNQAMNFRVSDGEKVSVPKGTRNEYEFVGWYTDEQFNNLFNAELVTLTHSNVTTPYDKSEDTDTMDKFGIAREPRYNSDKYALDETTGTLIERDRFWITTKLDLYGKWRAIIPGADGIGVIYDANGGSNPPNDTTLYEDTAKATAQPGATPPTTNDQFLYWVLQKWNGTGYEDIAGSKVYPGDGFEVLKENAQVSNIVYESGKIKSATYTIHLRAEYGPKEAPTPTHITWYANGGVLNKPVVGTDEYSAIPNAASASATTTSYIDLQINEAVPAAPADTFTRKGYKFIGWAREKSPDNSFDPVLKTVDESKYTAKENLTLWLKLNDDGVTYSEMGADGETVLNANVTKVAADERLDYHSLYAVWTSVFYVYHSGMTDGAIETVEMSECNSEGKYDITQNLTAGTLYGGYYYDYADNGSYADDGKPVSDSKAYEGGPGKWKYEDVFTSAQKKVGDKVVGGGIGTAMTPVAGVTYYVKEVPDDYLKSVVYVIYNDVEGSDDHTINDLYSFTSVDDANYSKVGFVYKGKNGPKGATDVGKLYKDYTITNSKDPSKTMTYTSNNMFKNNKNGYLAVKQKKEYLILPDTFEEARYAATSAAFQDTPYWVTPDGLQVTGTELFMVYIGNKQFMNWARPGITKQSKTQAATITTATN